MEYAQRFRKPTSWAGGAIPNDGRFGMLGRGTFRGPGFREYYVALIRDTALGRRGAGEAVTPEFRFKFFNVFDLVNFGLPANIFVRGSGFSVVNHAVGSSRRPQLSLELIC
ncbi:MAG: hypothetical protein KGM47_06105 [Acidobacteriota bacterium]|nr:hypothetical protein [Acidobacteriota bacterium]